MAGLAASFGSGAMTNSIADLSEAEVLFVIGSNTTEAHPIVALEIKKAMRRGAKLIVADPRRTWLAGRADQWLRLNPGSNIALLNAMAAVILAEGLEDRDFIDERTEGFEEFTKAVKGVSLDEAADQTGVSVELIQAAARLFAGTRRGAIVYSMGITQHEQGTDNVFALANLAMLAGNVGKPGSGVNPLRGQNNVQGACDVGCLPEYLPGYRRADDEGARRAVGEAWGVMLSDKTGLTVTEMTDAAATGGIKALFIMGENPVVSDPDTTHVVEALKSLELLIVSDIFLTETAELAHVVFPAASFAEKEGTFTNTERRVQRVRKGINPPGEAKNDAEIIALLARSLGWDFTAEAADVFDELARLVPQYGGLSHARLEEGGLQWPCPTSDHPGTTILHTDSFTRGKGRFTPVKQLSLSETAGESYPFVLTTGRVLHQYHTGSMTRRTKLDLLEPEAFIEINPEDAVAVAIEDGDKVRVTSRHGGVEVRARITDRVAAGTVFMPFHFAEAAANLVVGGALDPVAKEPALKTTAVRIEKL